MPKTKQKGCFELAMFNVASMGNYECRDGQQLEGADQKQFGQPIRGRWKCCEKDGKLHFLLFPLLLVGWRIQNVEGNWRQLNAALEFLELFVQLGNALFFPKYT